MQPKIQTKSNADPSVLVLPSYQEETLRPVVSLIFVAPILMLYEMACILFDQPVRTGIDQWLHHILDAIGGGRLIILPIVTAGVLLYLHHKRSDTWTIKPLVFLGMSVESMVLGLVLFAVATIYGAMMLTGTTAGTLVAIPVEPASQRWWPETLGYFGAGIYEELVFRLLMLPALVVVLACWMGRGTSSLVVALVLTSLLFALSHYNVLNPAGVSLEFSSFFFRFMASVVFCVVYLHRGFGIAVGTHVAYDVLTQL